MLLVCLDTAVDTKLYTLVGIYVGTRLSDLDMAWRHHVVELKQVRAYLTLRKT